MEFSTALSLTTTGSNRGDDGGPTSYIGARPLTSHNRPHFIERVHPHGFRSVPYDRVPAANQPRLINTVGQEILTTPGTVHWPTSFNIYDRTHLHWHKHIFIGTHIDQPLYRITSQKKRLNVRHGTSKFDPVIATLAHKSFLFGKRAGFVIPPLGHGSYITLDANYSFSCQVPTTDGRDTRLEMFEWRRSRGKAVHRLGKTNGYKLIRLATDVGRGGGEVATGGGEVVYVMTRHKVFAWNKAAQIMFQGTGAQGVLGAHWQLVAAMTAIGIWDYKRRKESPPAFSEA